ncbi:MAG: arginase family protein [Candidatus Methylomirabilales bacterium]
MMPTTFPFSGKVPLYDPAGKAPQVVVVRVHLVQFDAHLDFVDHFQGAKMTHGSPMRQATSFPR